jgi:hypothetical protein
VPDEEPGAVGDVGWRPALLAPRSRGQGDHDWRHAPYVWPVLSSMMDWLGNQVAAHKRVHHVERAPDHRERTFGDTQELVVDGHGQEDGVVRGVVHGARPVVVWFSVHAIRATSTYVCAEKLNFCGCGVHRQGVRTDPPARRDAERGRLA